jgi:hypothetical protein
METTLKALGFELLKLENEKLLPNFAFDFNLRQYTTGVFHVPIHQVLWQAAEVGLILDSQGCFVAPPAAAEVGRPRITLGGPRHGRP